MPRKRSIIVDDQTILAAIQAAYAADLEAEARLTAAIAADPTGDGYWDLRIYQQQRNGDRIKCDLARFWGRQPTPSERIRLQQCIRRLEAAGKVERSTVYIRPVVEVPANA